MQATSENGTEIYDAGSQSLAAATSQLHRYRGTSAKLLHDVKTGGVPAGRKLEEYFPVGSVHYDLINSGLIMIHTHGRAEYWVEAEQRKPTIGRTKWGQYYSTLVLIGVSGAVKGKNVDQVLMSMIVTFNLQCYLMRSFIIIGVEALCQH